MYVYIHVFCVYVCLCPCSSLPLLSPSLLFRVPPFSAHLSPLIKFSLGQRVCCRRSGMHALLRHILFSSAAVWAEMGDSRRSEPSPERAHGCSCSPGRPWIGDPIYIVWKRRQRSLLVSVCIYRYMRYTHTYTYTYTQAKLFSGWLFRFLQE